MSGKNMAVVKLLQQWKDAMAASGGGLETIRD
jgi:hypothetical protein